MIQSNKSGYTKSCHSKLDLESSMQVVCEQQQQAWKILNRVQDDNMITTPRAFTLIELLVVVLIIGILAAVALPQYQRVVKKTRYVELIVNMKSISTALERYRLEHGDYPDVSLAASKDPSALSDVLDIEIPPFKEATLMVYYNPSIGYVGYYDSKQKLWIAYWWKRIVDKNKVICYLDSGDTTTENVNLCKSLCSAPKDYSGSGAYSCVI